MERIDPTPTKDMEVPLAAITDVEGENVETNKERSQVMSYDGKHLNQKPKWNEIYMMTL